MSPLAVSGFPADVAQLREGQRAAWRRQGLYAGQTVAEALRERVPTHGGRFVIRWLDEVIEIGAAELYERARGVAGYFQSKGFRAGDVFAFQLPMSVEAVVLTFAAFELGAVLLPILPTFGAAELGFLLRQSRARAFVVRDAWRGGRHLQAALEVQDSTELAIKVVIGDQAPEGWVRWDECLAQSSEPRAVDVSPSDPCVLLYTSGTTSAPKGVVHSHETLLKVVEVLVGPRPGSTADVFLSPPAPGHIGGVAHPLQMALYGSTMVTLDRWSAEAAAQLVQDRRVGGSAGPPVFLYSLREAAAAQGFDLSSLKIVLLGGTAITPADVEGCEALGIRAHRCYGSTEHAAAASTWPDDPLEMRASTDGYAAPGTRIRIVDDAGTDLPLGQPGELALLGPQQFLGYLDPELNGAHFLPDGSFLTGDIAVQDAEGIVTVTGRKKDIIIRGGENISAKEVEDVLARMDGVLEAAVVGMPDARMGERVCAYLIVRRGVRIDLAAVAAHFGAAGVARYKTPERVEVVDEMPRTNWGKVRKAELREALKVNC